jgi:hypothetical protein
MRLMRAKPNRFAGLPILLICAVAGTAIGYCVYRATRVARGAEAAPKLNSTQYSGFPIKQCADALELFEENRLPELEKSASGKTQVFGVGCIDTGTGSLEILIICDRVPEAKPSDFPYKYGNTNQKPLPIRWVVGTVDSFAGAAAGSAPTAPESAPTVANSNPIPILCGSSAQGDHVNKDGTAGLNIIFNGTTVCLGNAHVMVRKKVPPTPPSTAPSTPQNTPVTLGGVANAGKLFGYKPITFADASPTATNLWDLAMAEYVNPVQAAKQMRPCQTTTFNYPAGFAKSGSVSTGQTAHYTGAASCGSDLGLLEGAFRVIGSIPEDNANKSVRFVTQLLFSHTTQDRDSGAVIVRTTDDCVLGLHVGDTSYMDPDNGQVKRGNYANPLFRVPWQPDNNPNVPNPNHLLMFKPDVERPYPDRFDDSLHDW